MSDFRTYYLLGTQEKSQRHVTSIKVLLYNGMLMIGYMPRGPNVAISLCIVSMRRYAYIITLANKYAVGNLKLANIIGDAAALVAMVKIVVSGYVHELTEPDKLPGSMHRV